MHTQHLRLYSAPAAAPCDPSFHLFDLPGLMHIHTSRAVFRPLTAGALSLVLAATVGAQNTPATVDACFVPASGTLYRIDTPASPAPGAPKACLSPLHTRQAWNQQGAPGASGPAGPQGAAGAAGTPGLVGLAGPQGAPGTPGSAGPAGVAGPIGPTGIAGPIGPTGVAGPIGPPGAVGSQGAAGPAGQDGAIGPVGPVGPNGPAGLQGPQGIQGLQGLPGLGVQTFATNFYDFGGPTSPSSGFVARGTLGQGSTNVPSGAGTRLLWSSAKGALRAGTVNGGQWDAASLGENSLAVGLNTTASGARAFAGGDGARATGDAAFAFGGGTTASGPASTALGQFTTASGEQSLAIGLNTTASGTRSFAAGEGSRATALFSFAFGFNNPLASGMGALAFGGGTTASGFTSVAMGWNTTADGNYSTALGSHVSTGGKGGAFIIGDVSTATAAVASADNQFTARFVGGYRLFTNGGLTAGVSLASGGGSWQSVSDVRKKTAFRPVDGETILAAIRAMPVRTWQYKSQDPSIRHMGPTAQDFRAAFALGESDTTITTVDADGVALAAARALEARTRTQGVTLATLRRENAALRTAVADVRRTSAALRTQLTVLLTRADEDRALRTRLARLAERLEGLDPTARAVVAGRR